MHKIIHGTDSTTLSFSYEATTSQPTSRILTTSVAPNPKPQKRQNQSIHKNSTIPQSNFYSSWGPSPECPLNFHKKHVQPGGATSPLPATSTPNRTNTKTQLFSHVFSLPPYPITHYPLLITHLSLPISPNTAIKFPLFLGSRP